MPEVEAVVEDMDDEERNRQKERLDSEGGRA